MLSFMVGGHDATILLVLSGKRRDMAKRVFKERQSLSVFTGRAASCRFQRKLMAIMVIMRKRRKIVSRWGKFVFRAPDDQSV